MKLLKMYESFKGNPKGIEVMEKTVDVFDKHLEDLKEAHPDLYKKLENKLYIAAYGYHFNEEMLKEALSTMINDDDSKSPKWKISDTTQVARNSGISFSKFNEYDWNYVMNMIYSDYCEVLGDNVMSYVKMANKFLNDKDAPDGKALRYYMCMKD